MFYFDKKKLIHKVDYLIKKTGFICSRCWMQIIQDKNTASMEKLIVKDNLVRELLCIPESIWQTLLKASADEEMVCLFFSKVSIHLYFN